MFKYAIIFGFISGISFAIYGSIVNYEIPKDEWVCSRLVKSKCLQYTKK